MNNQNPFAKIILLILMVTSSGCATKHYGRMNTLSGIEKSAYDCKTIEIEIAKCEDFINQVENESSFDARSVFSFLGDYGLGNKMEKDAAMKSARERLSALKSLKYERHCGEYYQNRVIGNSVVIDPNALLDEIK